MNDFMHKGPPGPNDDDLARGSRVVDRLAAGGRPVDRMEAGLVFALVGARDIAGISAIEDRRFALAMARGLARDREEGGIGMSSIDWARTFAVDASIQREAEKLLSLDMLDRQARLRWGSSAIQGEPWMQAGVPPSVFSKAAEEDLKAMASGSFQDLSVLRGPEVETSLLSAAQPAAPSLEVRLHLAAGTPPSGKDRDSLAKGILAADQRAFGPVDPKAWTGQELAAIADRMALARRAADVGHRDARGLFDPTPGRSPFATDHAQDLRGIAAVQGGEKGRLNRVAQAALEVLEGIDPAGVASGDDGIRLATAAARLVKAGPHPGGDERSDVRTLVADVLVQKCAADTVFGTVSPARAVLEEMVSGNVDSRESVGFWRRGQEEQMKAVAFGRFQDLDDSTGLASGIRNTIWRAEMVGSPSMNRRVETALANHTAREAPRMTGARGPARVAMPNPMPRSSGMGR